MDGITTIKLPHRSTARQDWLMFAVQDTIKGTTSMVHLCILQQDGEWYAIKYHDISEMTDDDKIYARREHFMLKSLCHPCIVRVAITCEEADTKKLWNVSEFYSYPEEVEDRKKRISTLRQLIKPRVGTI